MTVSDTECAEALIESRRSSWITLEGQLAARRDDHRTPKGVFRPCDVSWYCHSIPADELLFSRPFRGDAVSQRIRGSSEEDEGYGLHI